MSDTSTTKTEANGSGQLSEKASAGTTTKGQESDPKLGIADGATAVTKSNEGDNPDTRRRAKTCSEFEIGTYDGAGHLVQEIYFKRDKYTIYCTVDDHER